MVENNDPYTPDNSEPVGRDDRDEGLDRSGLELRVALVDYNRTDEEGNPYAVHTTKSFSNYELAMLDSRDFVEHVLSESSRDVLGYFRSEEYGPDGVGE